MVESVGSKAVSSSERRIVAVAQTNAPATVAKVATGAERTSALTGVAQTLAASPPVDFDRVARIKKAIANGEFPILPATVADRLLAFSLQWNSNDPS